MTQLWVEKYRPKTVTEYVFRDAAQKSQVESWIKSGSLPHLLFSGSPGTGKTTLAKLMLHEIGVNPIDILEINASNERNIDTLRGKIITFASSMPFAGDVRYVILDEADYLNCLAEDEKILLANGTELALKDMSADEKYAVVSFNEKTGEFEEDTAEVAFVAESETYLVELENGNSITVTADHPFIVKGPDGRITTRSIQDGLDGYEVILK